MFLNNKICEKAMGAITKILEDKDRLMKDLIQVHIAIRSCTGMYICSYVPLHVYIYPLCFTS